MKVVAFNGSVRSNGNTTILIKKVFEELKNEGIETELIELGLKHLSGCIACYKCFENKNKKCAIKSDLLNEYLEKMLSADCIILASPVYFSDVTANMKALIERAGMTSRGNENMLKRKIGAGIVSVRRGGAIHTFDTLNHFFLISEMIIAGSSYWNVGIGREIGEVLKDEEGLLTMTNLGKNIAWILKKIKA
jgi:multimeric flavodoxin WrbA